MADNTRPKILIEFSTVMGALEWFDDVRILGGFPADADLYCADGLDLQRGGDMRTFIVRNTGERPDKFTVRANLRRLVTKDERAQIADQAVDTISALTLGSAAESDER